MPSTNASLPRTDSKSRTRFGHGFFEPGEIWTIKEEGKEEKGQMHIRRANEQDLDRVLELLSQVLEVHAVIRPDLFISGTRKYTRDELREIFRDDTKPVFLVENSENEVLGYCFCQMQVTENSNNLRDSMSLFIDDICVDEKYRGQHVGKFLCDYVMDYARAKGCYDITLNVWEGNDAAREFYRKMGFGIRKAVMEKIL